MDKEQPPSAEGVDIEFVHPAAVATVTDAPETIWEKLNVWGQSLEDWQRFIVTQAERSVTLSDEQIDDACRLFARYGDLDKGGESLPEIPETITGRGDATNADSLILRELHSLKHVNAIPNESRLTFGPNLTVIYGHNGSGKSGFSRIMSSACSSRSKQKIINNIYNGDVSDAKAQAQFVIKKSSSSDETLLFTEEDEHPDLQRVSIFDSSVARIHITQDNELGFQPTGFDVFDEILRVIQIMTERLESEINRRERPNKFTNLFSDRGPVAEKIANLSADTNEDEIQAMGIFGDAEQGQLIQLDQEKMQLSKRSTAGVLKSLAEAKVNIGAVKEQLESATGALNSEACNAALGLVTEHNKISANALRAGAEAVSHPALNKIGSDEWISFVEASKALGLAEEKNYPSNDAPCLLCHRPLSEPSVTLIRRMWGHLNSEDRNALASIDDRVNNLISSLEEISVNLLPAESKIRSDLSGTNPEIISGIDQISGALEARRAVMVASLKTVAPDELPSGDMNLPLDVFATGLANLEGKEKAVKVGDFDRLIDEVESKRIALRQRQALSKSINDVVNFVVDLRWIRNARKAKGLLSTRFVTEERKRLFQFVIEGNYSTRLEQECKRLGHPLSFEFKTRGIAGKTLRVIKVRGHSPEKIFSEGEQRILALADFLTEVNLNPASAAIVLDDPVTSLDHKNRHAIVERLVKESSVRQVIIFTHDLVFLHLLLKTAKDSSTNTDCHWVDVRDGVPGHISMHDSPENSEDYKKDTSKAKEHLARAKGMTGQDRVGSVRDGADALRRTIEETIIYKLFKGVVRRWDERIRTDRLKDVKWRPDLANELVNLYGEVSRLIGAHSSSEAYAAVPPDPDELERLINKVEEVIGQIGQKPPSE